MTAIVVTKLSKNKCISASDRRLSIGDSEYTIDPYPKVKKLYGMLVGGAGEAPPIEIFFLLDSLKYLPNASDPMKYILMHLVPTWKAALQKACLLHNTQEPVDHAPQCDVFVAFRGRCFSLSLLYTGAISTLELSLPVAFGCGGSLALAALKGIQLYNRNNISHQLQWALQIVASMNSACDDNIDIIKE